MPEFNAMPQGKLEHEIAAQHFNTNLHLDKPLDIFTTTLTMLIDSSWTFSMNLSACNVIVKFHHEFWAEKAECICLSVFIKSRV